MEPLIERFLIATEKMREKQRNYYRTRSHYLLIDCMKLEQKVDQLIKQFHEREGTQLKIKL